MIHAFREWLPIYFVAVLAASLSPFPVLGHWEGDWLLLYEMGQSVIQGHLAGDMLARPPLFGAAAAPLWIVSHGLIPYQLMAAVASASAATVMFSFIEHFRPRAPRIVLLPFLLSPFFLHNAAAAWSKPLAAGLIVAAVIEGLSARRWVSSALFALAVAVHEGSIIWAPSVLLVHLSGSTGWRSAARALGRLALTGLLFAGPLEIWVLMKYGLTAKMAMSPVVADSGKTSFLAKTVLAVISTFVGWGPIVDALRWLRSPNPTAYATASKEAYWLVTSWITTLAGTLVGLLFPFILVRRAARDLFAHLGTWPILGLAIAVVMNALLTPFYGNEGTMQVGLVPLGYVLYGLLAARVARLDDQRDVPIRRMAWLMGLAGTLPWLLTNACTSAGLWLSAAFRERIRTGSEGDYFRVMQNRLEPLGMAAFPEVPLLCCVLLIGWALFLRRQRRSIDGLSSSKLPE
jgi:hypothetical protein